MRIEVLCTGDELLNGVTADTNSPYFMARLQRLGEQVTRTTVVGDDRVAIREALKEIAARADVVLVSGGLGPTSDDVTAEAAAEAAGVPLIQDEAAAERIRARLAKRNLPLTENHLRQARVPRGADVAINDAGSAPFFALRFGRCEAFFVPGVPREYRHLVEAQVLPRIDQLRAASGAAGFLAFRILKTVGIPEAQLDAMVAPLAKAYPEVTFGFRTESPENHLELLVRGTTREEAEAKLEQVERASKQLLGDDVFGVDGQTLAGVVVFSLEQRSETVVVAESCTGGMVAVALTHVTGSSTVFAGGAVTYVPAVKRAFADVPPELVSTRGEVSAEVARAMAEGIRRTLNATWAVSVTGFAGPGGGTATEPVGSVYIAVAGPDGTTHRRHLFGGDRDAVRVAAAGTALDALRRRLLDEERRR